MTEILAKILVCVVVMTIVPNESVVPVAAYALGVATECLLQYFKKGQLSG